MKTYLALITLLGIVIAGPIWLNYQHDLQIAEIPVFGTRDDTLSTHGVDDPGPHADGFTEYVLVDNALDSGNPGDFGATWVTSGDVGTSMLGVQRGGRNDGDYVPLQVDEQGRLLVKVVP